MAISLDPEEKMIHGKTTLLWKNPSADTIIDLHFHLYYNAFKNSKSTFWESADFGRRPSGQDLEDCVWGWSEMSNIKDQAGNELFSTYIQPDDGNEHDLTVLKVNLSKPVMPYDSVLVTYDFTVKVPKVMIRTGYSRDYFFLAQWYPKVGVYEPAGMRYATEGQWNCHQYHPKTEYYGEFGNYEVAITVPTNYIVGASGTLQNVQENNGATKTHTFYLEDVIDYAWTASPNYLVYEDRWKQVDLRLMTFPGHEVYSERYMNAAKYSLEYFDNHLGSYPYQTLTIVDVPYHGMFTGAMEYPTFISALNLRIFPEDVLLSETFTVHEFTHQYFQQMVSTNEQEEPWMDEGFTTYWEGRILDHYYGDKTSTFNCLGVRAGNIEHNRIGYTTMWNPQVTPTAATGWDTKVNGYRSITYNKTAVWLRTLEGLVGLETNDEIWRTFFERWKFKHPCGQDFIDVVNEIVVKNHGNDYGENMDWFFDQVHFGSGLCDYALASISNQLIPPTTGVFDGECLTGEQEASSETQYLSRVLVDRHEEVQLPVEVLVHFENGEEILEKWDGKDRRLTLEYKGTSKVAWAEVDPQRKIYLDINFNNNSLCTTSQKLPVRKMVSKFLLWMQNVMQTVTLFV